MNFIFNKNKYILKFIKNITKDFKYTKEERIIINILINKLKNKDE